MIDLTATGIVFNTKKTIFLCCSMIFIVKLGTPIKLIAFEENRN